MSDIERAPDGPAGALPVVVIAWPAEIVVEGAAVGPEVTVVSAGQWLVRTRTSSYLIDLDDGVAARFPGSESPPEHRVANLRRDAEDIRLTYVTAAVGAAMVLVLAIRDGGVPTVRTTTEVLAIGPAPRAPFGPSSVHTLATRDPGETE